MICGVRSDALDMTIGVDRMPYRKKICLVIEEGNRETKYATFNNDDAAKEFMIKLAKMLNLDWRESEWRGE